MTRVAVKGNYNGPQLGGRNFIVIRLLIAFYKFLIIKKTFWRTPNFSQINCLTNRFLYRTLRVSTFYVKLFKRKDIFSIL